MNAVCPSSSEWQQRCLEDGEFMQAARYWNGGIRLVIGDEPIEVLVKDGVPGDECGDESGMIQLSGLTEVWDAVLAAVPSRFNNDVLANMTHGLGLERRADSVQFAQYYAAVARAVELLRPEADSGSVMAHDQRAPGTIDAPVGRYVHLDLGGQDFRIYYEEAGQGIPVLLQHTAGCHGSQWRHLFEMPEITSRFRLIAYDLPFHGKSMPPASDSWWESQYLLKGELLRSIPIQLSSVLELDRPVFMGCSVGGLLALDLAHKHAELFRAVISVEGALKVEGKLADLGELWHPQISNEYKARVMGGLMSPTSPLPYRKETSFVYASGWPPVFLGDLNYYMEDYDLRSHAHEIDTGKVGVHILSGEYDYSGTAEMGRAASEAIAGSTWSEMKGVGHFPMSENPDVFKAHLLPVLERIAHG